MTAAEDAFAFLRSPQGRAMVTRALQRRGLPLGLRDDLEAEVLRRVVGAEARETIDNPAGFATNAAQYAAADLLRGELRRSMPTVPTRAEDEDVAFDVPSDEAVDEDVVSTLAVRDLRVAVMNGAATAPARAASALAYVTVRIEGAPVGPSCPEPVAGAGPEEAAEWAALWYGGRADCFPSDSVPDGPTVRKRRSRAVAHLRAALIDAARAIDLEDGDG